MTSVVTCDPTASLSPLDAIKVRQQAMWASGDFAVIGTTIQIVGELLCEGVDLRAGERVLDVAAGNGNATLAAARRFASVTSTGIVKLRKSRSTEPQDISACPLGSHHWHPSGCDSSDSSRRSQALT